MDGWIVSQSMSKYYDVCLSSSNQESHEGFFVFGRDISALFLAPRNLQSCLCVRLAVIGQVPNSDQRKGGGAGLSRS